MPILYKDMVKLVMEFEKLQPQAYCYTENPNDTVKTMLCFRCRDESFDKSNATLRICYTN